MYLCKCHGFNKCLEGAVGEYATVSLTATAVTAVCRKTLTVSLIFLGFYDVFFVNIFLKNISLSTEMPRNPFGV